jgi:hypothetical protein
MDRSIVLAAIFFVTTVVLSVVVAFKFTKKKKPVWAHNTRKIIGKGTDAPPELKMTFNELPVNDVYQSVFIFFNRGTETIRNTDVAEAIAVQFEGSKILREPTTLAKSKEANKLSVRHLVKDGNDAIEINFLYLDHDDGVVFEVFRTRSKKIIYPGIIMGANEIRHIGEFLPYHPPRRSDIIYAVAFTFFGFGSIIILGRYFIPQFVAQHSSDLLAISIAVIVFFIVGLCHLFIDELPVFLRHSKFPKWTGSLKLPWID